MQERLIISWQLLDGLMFPIDLVLEATPKVPSCDSCLKNANANTGSMPVSSPLSKNTCAEVFAGELIKKFWTSDKSTLDLSLILVLHAFVPVISIGKLTILSPKPIKSSVSLFLRLYHEILLQNNYVC